MKRRLLGPAWSAVLRRAERGGQVRVTKATVPHPRRLGAHLSMGLARGQVADWRWTLVGGRCLHVLDLGTHWSAHVDQVSPDIDLVGHLRADAPGILRAALCIGGAVAGATLGGPLGAVGGAAIAWRLR